MIRRIVAAILASSLAAQPSVASMVGTTGAGTQTTIAYNTLFLSPDNFQPIGSVFTFNSAAAVGDAFGTGTTEYSQAQSFFAGTPPAQAHMLFARMPLGGGRSRIFGAPVGTALSAITSTCTSSSPCTMSLAWDGYPTVTATGINLSGAGSLATVASDLQTAINNAVPTQSTLTASVTAESCAVTGYMTAGVLTVKTATSNCLVQGGQISATGTGGVVQVLQQVSGTPGGAGTYSIWYNGNGNVSFVPLQTLTETWGQLSITAATGSLQNGQVLIDTTGTLHINSVLMNTIIPPSTGYYTCSGLSCVGSTWVINYAQTVASESMTSTQCPISIGSHATMGVTQNTTRFWVEHAPNCLDYPLNTMGWATGTAAQVTGLTQGATGVTSTGTVLPAILAATGQLVPSTDYAAWMEMVATQYTSAWTYFQLDPDPDMGNWPNTAETDMLNWASGTQWTYTPVWTDTAYAATSYPPPTCSPGSQVFTSSGTLSPQYCLRLDIYAIGPAGNSAAGSTSAAGASGASGGFCSLAGIRGDEGVNSHTITVGAAGSGTESSVTGSELGGSLDAAAGGNAATTTAGAAGTQTCNATAAFGANNAVAISTVAATSVIGSAGGTANGNGGAGGPAPGGTYGAGAKGGTATVSGGGGGAGTDGAGMNSSSSTGQAGGNGAPSGSPTGGAAQAMSGSPCNAAGTASAGQDGAGGGGGPGWATGTPGEAGCAGAAGDYYAGLSTGAISSFGAGGGGGGGGGANGTVSPATNGGNGGAGGNYGGAGGGGGKAHNSGAPGNGGTSAPGAVGVTWHN
jgi:Protein of unknown function (DUF3383)